MSVFKYDAQGPYIDKDPRARLDYTLDWADWLETSATIASSVWSAADGVTLEVVKLRFMNPALASSWLKVMTSVGALVPLMSTRYSTTNGSAVTRALTVRVSSLKVA